MRFTLICPREVRFGAGCLAELPVLASARGRHVALARGGSGLHAHVERLLRAAGLTVTLLPTQTREPEPADVDAAADLLRESNADVVVALGGGSIIDLAKAAAALAPQPHHASVRDYLEGVGTGLTLEVDPLPLIALPTTAGTGAEATKNAVISSREEGFKKSLRDARMVPQVVVIDPELTLDLPPHLTAATGMDALTQLIEAYTTRNTNPVTDALALRGLEAGRSLPAAVANGADLAARTDMALAAHLSGLCLANSGLGAAHGIAAALGSIAPVPHGLACALALPWVMAMNLPAVEARYARVGAVLTGRPESDAHDALRAVWTLSRTLGIPRVTALPEAAEAFTEAHLPRLAALCHGNSLRGNPRPLTDAELIRLLRAMRDAENPWALVDV